MTMRPPRSRAAIAQLAVVGAVLAWLTVAPPARGFVLLVPVTAHARPAAAAVAQRMEIVAAAPLRSIVARASEGHDDAALLRQGIVPLAAPRSWCGGQA